MPGVSLTNRELIDKLRTLLRLKHGRIHYLARREGYVSNETKRLLSEEICILLRTNQDKPTGAVLREESYQWHLQHESSTVVTGVIEEPIDIDEVMDY